MKHPTVGDALRLLVGLYASVLNGLMLALAGGLFGSPMNHTLYWWIAVPSWLVLTWTAVTWVMGGE